MNTADRVRWERLVMSTLRKNPDDWTTPGSLGSEIGIDGRSVGGVLHRLWMRGLVESREQQVPKKRTLWRLRP